LNVKAVGKKPNTGITAFLTKVDIGDFADADYYRTMCGLRNIAAVGNFHIGYQ